MPRKRGSPHKAKTNNPAVEAWWYEDKDSIDVYVYDNVRKLTLRCEISRASLLSYINRSKKPLAKKAKK